METEMKHINGHFPSLPGDWSTISQFP